MGATFKRELREALEYAPQPNAHNPNGLLYWIGVPGVVCFPCASRLTGRGMGSMLRGFSEVYVDSQDKPRVVPACLGCGRGPAFAHSTVEGKAVPQ